MHTAAKHVFEEWDDPLIAGIGWVSELIEIAGGIDIFANRRNQRAAKDRIVTIEAVVERQPDVTIGSWCGKKFRPERVASRPGFAQTQALQHQHIYEIKSSLILQPGPAALTDGVAEPQRIIARWASLLVNGGRLTDQDRRSRPRCRATPWFLSAPARLRPLNLCRVRR
jgi:iron complex transport system substrate-binding protein